MWRFAIIAVQCGKPVLCIYYICTAPLAGTPKCNELFINIRYLSEFLEELLQNLVSPEIDNVSVPSNNFSVNILPFVKASMYWQLNFPPRFHYLIASFFTYHILLLILWSFNHILQLRKQNLTDINMIRLYSY